MGIVYKLYHMESKTYVTLGKIMSDGEPPYFEDGHLAAWFLSTHWFGNFEMHNDHGGPCPENGPEPETLQDIRPCMEEGKSWIEVKPPPPTLVTAAHAKPSGVIRETMCPTEQVSSRACRASLSGVQPNRARIDVAPKTKEN